MECGDSGRVGVAGAGRASQQEQVETLEQETLDRGENTDEHFRKHEVIIQVQKTQGTW